MQYRPGLLDGFLASTHIDLTPFSTPALKDRQWSQLWLAHMLAATAREGAAGLAGRT
jgi:hypothetical protein